VAAGRQARRRAVLDHTLKADPAHIIVLCEANSGVEKVLRDPPGEAPQQTAVAGVSNLQCRKPMEWWVQRGQEQDSAILVASRMDNTTGIELVDYTVLEDHRWQTKRNPKWRNRGL
jgi:hypothetical protein